MRARDRERVKALRLVNAAHQAGGDRRPAVLSKTRTCWPCSARCASSASTRSINSPQAGREDLAAIERFELAIIDEFMPRMLGDEEPRRGHRGRHRRDRRRQHEGHGQGDEHAQEPLPWPRGHGRGEPSGARSVERLTTLRPPRRTPIRRRRAARSRANGLCSLSMAGMIPQSFINGLLERTDPVDVIGRRVQLRKVGNRHTGLCPFHQEKTPSFHVYPDGYHCFGCGAHGTALGFLMELDGLTFPEAVEALAEMAGLEVPRERGTGPKIDSSVYDTLEAAAQRYRQWLGEGAEGTKAQGVSTRTRPRCRDHRALRRRPRPARLGPLEDGARLARRRAAGRSRSSGEERAWPHLRPLPRSRRLPHPQHPRGASSASAAASSEPRPQTAPSTSTRRTRRTSAKAANSTASTKRGRRRAASTA